VFALDDKQARAVEERVLPRAVEQTLADSAVRATGGRSRGCATVEEQRAEAMKRGGVPHPRDDGMTELWALLPAEGAAAVMTPWTRWFGHFSG